MIIKKRNRKKLASGLLAGMMLTAALGFTACGQQGATVQNDGSAAQAESESGASGKDVDIAKTFPSWNPESAHLKELTGFVADCTDESGKGYVAPEDRIVTFDMDGTVICEKAPVYFDWCLSIHRVLDDPDYNPTKAERKSAEEILKYMNTGETFYPESGPTKDDFIAKAFAGMTPEEFRKYTLDYADRENAVGFEGMTYRQSFYKPMIEVIDYLRANDFDIWMVSACEREVVRALMVDYDIPYDHVIATDVPYDASGNKKGEVADEYDITQKEEIVLGTPLDPIETGKFGKPAAIAREIGKRPVLAFGNSSGDFSMLNYAEGNPDHAGMGVLVVCDDTEREYGSEEKADEYYAEVEKENWTPFSMAEDWETIYGEGVEKTELPGAED